MHRFKGGETLLDLARNAPALEYWVSRARAKTTKKRRQGAAFARRDDTESIGCDRAALDEFFAEMNFPSWKPSPAENQASKSSGPKKRGKDAARKVTSCKSRDAKSNTAKNEVKIDPGGSLQNAGDHKRQDRKLGQRQHISAGHRHGKSAIMLSDDEMAPGSVGQESYKEAQSMPFPREPRSSTAEQFPKLR